MAPILLIIDDESTIRRSLRHLFESKGYTVLEADTGATGLALAQNEEPDVVLLDLKLPDTDGLVLLPKIKSAAPDPAVIMITAKGSIESAVAAIKSGAEDYLTKPFELDEVELLVTKSLDLVRLRRENLYYKSRGQDRDVTIPGHHASIKALNELVTLLAANPTTVLIQGESGTGKELVARAIHFRSARKEKPFVEINCAGLSENLLESELFGHERGAFTDAKVLKRGLLEVADNGTIFLDEIGDLPLSVQPKLLRVLEAKTFRRVGGTRDISVDVRIVTASNKKLAEEVEKGNFREDLYYRLNVMPLIMPPLRERVDDILVLADLFVQEFNDLLKKKVKGYSPEAQRLLLAYPWPGNVRELKNVTERAMILCTGDLILPTLLPAELQELSPVPLLPAPSVPEQPSLSPSPLIASDGSPAPLEEMEKQYIQQILSSVEGNRSQAARILGISRSTLQDKIKKYNL